MMKRFSRRRKGASEGKRATISASEWLPRILEQGIVDATSLDPWADSEVPETVAAIGQGERADGSKLIVSFSPRSATEALLGGVAAAALAAEKSEFAGQVLVIAPQWPAGARRLLGLLGSTAYSVEPIAATGLADGRLVVEAEPDQRILAASAGQLAARMKSAEGRAAFTRAAMGLEGLAAKHGGCVRVGVDRLELVVMARRVAEIRAEGDSAVLEVQVGGRTTTPISGADLAGALDGLEGQLRRRLNDRKVRDGEDGLRGRIVAQLAEGTELRGLRPWPQPGMELDDIDAVGINAEGDPVIVAIREEFDWQSMAAVLESLPSMSGLLPVLFSDTAPPLQLGSPRLLLAAERFLPALERAMAAFTVAYELRTVSGKAASGSMNLVNSGAGEGAQAKPSRRGRRRGGRGRTGSGSDAEDGGGEDGSGDEGGSENRPPRGPRGPRADAANTEGGDGESNEDSGDGDGEGRGRGRRRRRSRRSRGASDGESAEASSDGDGESAESGEGGKRPRARFESVSLMDLDDGPSPSGSSRGAASQVDGGDSDGDSPGGERSRRSRRRGKRGGGRDDQKGANASGSEGKDSDDEEDSPDASVEDDFVDADDLSEILARLDDVPDFDEEPTSEPSYDDEEEIEDGDDSPKRNRRPRRGAASDADQGEDNARAAARKRSAILVHADRDSLFAAILLARDIRQLEGLWIYPQSELMTFFRSVATDMRDDTPIFVIGFSPSPARDVIQASSLYRGRLTWFDRHAWPPEDLAGLRESLGADSIVGGEGIDSTLPLVLDTCSRRSRFSDKLVDLATGRFTQHDFERWGRLWRHRADEIAQKTGDIRADVAPLLAGRPSDLAKEAALVEIPAPPPEVAWVAERDFRLVHFGGHMMVVMEIDEPYDAHLAGRIARERYDASLSLVRQTGDSTFIFGGDETTGKRSLDYLAIAEHLDEKLEWVDAQPDSDHVSRFRIQGLDRNPERLEEVVSEIAMGRSMLER
ncbi:MAG: hypothetical protein AB8G23_08695 [Myxococcota bacterium]